jgi:hypothetical protein
VNALLVLVWQLVDPRGLGERDWFGVLTDEPFGVAGVGGGEGVGSDRVNRLSVSMVDVVRGVPGDARVPVLLGVVPGDEAPAERASTIEPNRSGKSGRYFRARTCASL